MIALATQLIWPMCTCESLYITLLEITKSNLAPLATFYDTSNVRWLQVRLWRECARNLQDGTCQRCRWHRRGTRDNLTTLFVVNCTSRIKLFGWRIDECSDCRVICNSSDRFISINKAKLRLCSRMAGW